LRWEGVDICERYRVCTCRLDTTPNSRATQRRQTLLAPGTFCMAAGLPHGSVEIVHIRQNGDLIESAVLYNPE